MLKTIALATGHEADVAAIDEKLEGIRSTFDSLYWKCGYYISAQVTAPDDRANAMAVNVGLADRAKWATIYENVRTKKTLCELLLRPLGLRGALGFAGCVFRIGLEERHKLGRSDCHRPRLTRHHHDLTS